VTIAPYQYVAYVTAVHDGDTLTVRVDLGFDTWRVQNVRLIGINARELSQPGGREARDHLAALVWPWSLLVPANGDPVKVGLISVAYDKYGDRVDGDVLLNGELLSARMIRDGYAAPWDGRGKAPVPPWPIPGATS
jgi:endonuclease YncB( thermonuclease family)